MNLNELETDYLLNDVDSDSQYLVFRLANEFYGVPLLSVREVVEKQTVKPIPNMVASFLGVFNLRGEIVSVIDLRMRFGFDESRSETEQVYLVFDSDKGPIAAVVDEVMEVVAIEENQLQKDINYDVNVPLEFIIGLSKYRDHLVSIIELSKILSKAELLELNKGLAPSKEKRSNKGNKSTNEAKDSRTTNKKRIKKSG